MALVDYASSDDSDIQQKPTTEPFKTAISSSKPFFQKVVDRANPGKIRVSLPQAALKKDEEENGEPASKRVKSGTGGFGGFNSFLPAPKRSGQAANGSNGAAASKRGGLGAGVSLKTGAEPGFSRQPEPTGMDEQYANTYDGEEEVAEQGFAKKGSALSLSPRKALQHSVTKPSSSEESKPAAAKPMMFMPLSVTRKNTKLKKKKDIQQAQSSESANSTPTSIPATPEPPPKRAAKVSLFSLSSSEPVGPSAKLSEERGEEYAFETPHDYHATPDYSDSPSFPPPAVPTPPVASAPQNLTSIASELNLTPAERRQLFGRQKSSHNAQEPKILNFSTTQEYLHNETLIKAQEGEPKSHGPVRSIAPGKHSLKQLVSAAQGQKEALEESFATGKGNRKEAGDRYGW